MTDSSGERFAREGNDSTRFSVKFDQVKVMTRRFLGGLWLHEVVLTKGSIMKCNVRKGKERFSKSVPVRFGSLSQTKVK